MQRTTDEEKDHKRSKRSQNLRILGVFTGCTVIFFLMLRIENIRSAIDWFLSVLSPIFWGVAMAYLLNPVVLFFEKCFTKVFAKNKLSVLKKQKIIKTFSITLTIILAITLLTSLILMVIPEFLKSLQKLIDAVPVQLKNFLNWLDQQAKSDNPMLQNFGNVFQKIVDYFNNWLTTNLDEKITKVLTIASDSIWSVINFIADFFIAIVVTVYALIEKKRFIGQVKKLLFAVFSPERANDILLTARHGHNIFGKYLSGKIIDSIMVGIVCFIIMTIFGIPYPVLVSVIVGFTNVIPFFGPFIGGIPSAMIILLTNTNKGIIFIIMIFILQQVEGSIIEPRILGYKTGISEFWVTFSLLLFGGMFGFLGMIIAVPLFAVLYYIVKTLVNRWLVNKELPVSSAEYYNVKCLERDGFVYLQEQSDDEKKEVKPSKKEDKNPDYKNETPQ